MMTNGNPQSNPNIHDGILYYTVRFLLLDNPVSVGIREKSNCCINNDRKNMNANIAKNIESIMSVRVV